jgi:hypothetical protein
MKNRLFSLFALLTLASLVAFGADVTGKWMSEATGKGGPQTFTLKQSGSALTGTVEGGRGGPVEISNGKVDGDNVSFEVTRDMGDKGKFTTKYSGKVEGSTMTLNADAGRGPREVKLTKQ